MHARGSVQGHVRPIEVMRVHARMCENGQGWAECGRVCKGVCSCVRAWEYVCGSARVCVCVCARAFEGKRGRERICEDMHGHAQFRSVQSLSCV